MGKGKRIAKRNTNGRRNRRNVSFRTALPMAFASGAKLLRTFEVFSRIDDNSWLNSLSRWGAVAMQLFTKVIVGEDSLMTATYPVGALQSFLLRPDDLVVSSVFSRKTSNDNLCNLNFQKLKIHSVGIRIRSTAAPSMRAGRLAMVFTPLTETESLELSGELKDLRYVQQGVTSFDDLLQMPGVKVGPASTGLRMSWSPPAASWIRDYIRVGRSLAVGSSSKAFGPPFARLFVGFKDYSAGKSDTVPLYGADHSMFEIDLTATVSFAEWGDTEVQWTLTSKYDPRTVTVTLENGTVVNVPSLGCRMEDNRFLIPTLSLHRAGHPSRRSSVSSIASQFDRIPTPSAAV